MSTSPSSPHVDRAVVLGGSLAGLLAAVVLRRHVAEVVVVDRDPLDGELTAPRRGVPQGPHTHGLLVGGVRAIEDLLPGFTESLVGRGARKRDVLDGARLYIGGGSLHRSESGLLGLLASRTLIESEVRHRVARLPGVVLRGGHDIVGLLASPDGGRVTGVRLAERDRAGASGEVTLDAALVVDATGRGSRAPVWVTELGYPAPPESVVPAGIAYVTRIFRSRPGVLDDLDADVIGTNPPDRRSGVALRQEGDRWTVTITGMHGEQPPTDLDAFTRYAAELPLPGLAQIARECEPLSDALVYRYPSSRWRHWEKVDRRPAGFVVLGDAVCSFNPVYGQGMSSAAQQAGALGDLLDELQGVGDAELPHRAAAAFAAVVAVPWALATGGDRRFPGLPRKPLPERVLDRYLDRLLRVARRDRTVCLAFVRVLNLLAAPPSLLTPGIALRVLRPGASRAVTSGSPPAGTPSVRAVPRGGSGRSAVPRR